MKIGDVVRLKSGGLAMTVVRDPYEFRGKGVVVVGGAGGPMWVDVAWIAGDGTPFERAYPVGALLAWMVLRQDPA